MSLVVLPVDILQQEAVLLRLLLLLRHMPPTVRAWGWRTMVVLPQAVPLLQQQQQQEVHLAATYMKACPLCSAASSSCNPSRCSVPRVILLLVQRLSNLLPPVRVDTQHQQQQQAGGSSWEHPCNRWCHNRCCCWQ